MDGRERDLHRTLTVHVTYIGATHREEIGIPPDHGQIMIWLLGTGEKGSPFSLPASTRITAKLPKLAQKADQLGIKHGGRTADFVLRKGN
jgi:hypothetical protein